MYRIHNSANKLFYQILFILVTGFLFIPINVFTSDTSTGEPYLVEDIHFAPHPNPGSSPHSFFKMGDTIFFCAYGGYNNGSELWKTDGTSEGTIMIRDIVPGHNSSSIEYMTELSGEIIFKVSTYDFGIELWKSDGTYEGTTMVKDINPGRGSSHPEGLCKFGNYIYFQAVDPILGDELWRTDGTEGGTIMVKDINPGSDSSSPYLMIDIDGTLFFTANDGVYGGELWKSDGTEGGTVMIKDIRPSGSSDIFGIVDFNGMAYFSAYEVINGNELWKSDGTPGGTVMVCDAVPGTGGSCPEQLTPCGTTLFYAAQDSVHGRELWKTDGTPTGTMLIKDIRPGSGFSQISYLTVLGDTLYFLARDNSQWSLWKSNGTESGTQIVKILNTDPDTPKRPTDLMTDGTYLYFMADDGVNGREVWKSDGTQMGTSMLKDINPTGDGVYYPEFSFIDGVLYFRANNGVQGYEPWKSDGTEEGTVMIKNIVKECSDRLYMDDPVNLNGNLLFRGRDQTYGSELRISDGTPSSVELVKDIIPGSDGISMDDVVVMNGFTYFVTDDDISGIELWKTDGTASNTMIVKDINPGASSTNPRFTKVIDDTLYFSAYEPTHGRELWKSNGLESGTVLVKDIWPGSPSSSPSDFCKLGDWIYFSAETEVEGHTLWKTDGTEVNTVLFKDISPATPYSEPMDLLKAGSQIFFSCFHPSYGQELWKTDGTDIGTVLVKDIIPGIDGGWMYYMVEYNNQLFFSVNDSTHGKELWKSDGTEVGTVMVKDIWPGAPGSEPSNLVVVDGLLYFSAIDESGGCELWTSDGTSVGTVRVKDIFPGNLGSRPQYLTPCEEKGIVFFNATDEIHGSELWLSDGTLSGTKLIKDIQPLLACSNPEELTLAGDILFFQAWSPFENEELWALPIYPTPTPTPTPSPTPTPFPYPIKPHPPLELYWARNPGSSEGGDFGNAIAALSNGASLVTGTFQGNAVFGELYDDNRTILEGIGNQDIFVSKYDPEGNIEWAKKAGGGDWDQGIAISAHPNGYCIVAGSFEGTATFGPGEIPSFDLVSDGYNDMFVAKYNSDGSVAWAKRAGGASYDYGYGVCVIPDGSCFVTGSFRSTAVFGFGETNVTSLDSDGLEDIFLAKYNPDGTLDWAKRAGGTGVDIAYSVSALPDGTSFITGSFSDTANFGSIPLTSPQYSDMFVVKYNPDGTVAWAKRAGGNNSLAGKSIAVMGHGDTLVTGWFYQSATFGYGESRVKILSGYDDEIFVAKYNNDGTLEWAKRAGGAGEDEGNSLSPLANGGVFVTGRFGYDSSSSTGRSATFGPGEDHETTLTSEGYDDVFIALYDSDGSLAWVKQGAGASRGVGNGIAASITNSVCMTGWFTDSIRFGIGEDGERELTSAGYADAFVVKYARPNLAPNPTPEPPPAAEIINDDFDGTSLDPDLWEVTEGSEPPLGSSLVQIQDCKIQTTDEYAGIPLWIVFSNISYTSLPSGSAWLELGISAENGSSCGMRFSMVEDSYLEGFVCSYKGHEDWEPLNIYGSVPTDIFDVAFCIYGSKTYMYLRGENEKETPHLNVRSGPIKCYLKAENGAIFCVDTVSVFEQSTYNPAYRLVEPGAYYAYDFGTTGVNAHMSNLSSEYGYMKVEQITGEPTGFPFSKLAYYWDINGMESMSFQTNLLFGYSPADLSLAGIPEGYLKCFRSENNGMNWDNIPGTNDPISHSLNVRNISGFSQWILGSDGTYTPAKFWTLYE